jgi:hypothetical protein
MTAQHHLDLRRFPCARCNAAPGAPCRRPSGMTTTEHIERFDAYHADRAWRRQHGQTA